LQSDADLAVVGPMARSAGDLALALDVVAGPDEEREGVGYRLALRPPRHNDLKSFRVLVIDNHPLIPTGTEVRAALDGWSERLAKAGVKLAHASPLLPDLSDSSRTLHEAVDVL
jgi:amidase